MARFNTAVPLTSVSTGSTVPSPTYGALTSLTGTAPYTVILASPITFQGTLQSFYNATSGVVTLSSPSGNIKGPGFTAASTQTMPAGASYTLISDGTDYVINNNEGGPQAATTMTVSSTFTAQAGVSMTGSSIATSASQSVSGTYDVVNLSYLRTNYGNAWSVKNSGYTAVAGDRLFVDTTSATVTITLPSSASLGDTIQIVDFGGTFNTRNCTVGNNGLRIQGTLDTMTVSTNGAAFTLVYSGNATYGWRMAQGI
jgi:hypothetical protein